MPVVTSCVITAEPVKTKSTVNVAHVDVYANSGTITKTPRIPKNITITYTIKVMVSMTSATKYHWYLAFLPEKIDFRFTPGFCRVLFRFILFGDLSSSPPSIALLYDALLRTSCGEVSVCGISSVWLSLPIDGRSSILKAKVGVSSSGLYDKLIVGMVDVGPIETLDLFCNNLVVSVMSVPLPVEKVDSAVLVRAAT